ncbi:MAG: hypothetical protein LJF04_16950 [Gemmatimonadetes bacterium]|nr:hypothetical protein [Gemmatimonadota bacterium]
MRSLRGAKLRATSPDGRTCAATVTGFALVGGKPTDERLARTGRVDVRVREEDGAGPIGLRWEIEIDR